MATYAEMRGDEADSTLTVLAEQAVRVSIDKIRAEDPQTFNHAGRVKWALHAALSPDAEGIKILSIVIASQRALDNVDILALSETDFQVAFDAAVTLFAQG